MMRPALLAFGLGAAILAAIPAGADPQQAPNATFRTGVDAVAVEASVRRGNRPVTGLKIGDFQLLDNGVPQQISDLNYERLPIDVTVLLEGQLARRDFADWSMGFQAIDAAAASGIAGFTPFLDAKFSVFEFASDPSRAFPFRDVCCQAYEERVNLGARGFYATPAIADGRIYIRTRSALYSFGK